MYALGHAELGQYGRLMAAVLAGGPGALLSHQSAGDLSEILRTSSALIHVTTPNRRRRRLENIVFHRARELHLSDRTIKHGIPLTALPRTLLDLSECVPPNRLRQAIEQSERIGLFDLTQINQLIERSRGRHGLKLLTALLAQLADAGPPPDLRSANEQRFRDLCLEYGVPTPSFNVVVCGHLVDAYWPRQQLVVEIDAYGTHSDRETFESDRERDVALRLEGISVLRFTDRRISGNAANVAATVLRALSLRAP